MMKTGETVEMSLLWFAVPFMPASAGMIFAYIIYPRLKRWFGLADVCDD